MLYENLKITIDFVQKICYYIFKEREPKSSRDAGTGPALIHERRAAPMGC